MEWKSSTKMTKEHWAVLFGSMLALSIVWNCLPTWPESPHVPTAQEYARAREDLKRAKRDYEIYLELQKSIPIIGVDGVRQLINGVNDDDGERDDYLRVLDAMTKPKGDNQ